MNLLGAILYDPSSSATKACTSNIAMTAFDTTNLRLAITVPSHGYIRVKLSCAIEGAATYPQILLGVMDGATVRGRISPQITINGTALATTRAVASAEFTIAGLTPGAMTLDAAYGVEFLVASSNIRYGGPNNTTASDAWGGFQFEIWDPKPAPANWSLHSIDANGRVDVIKIAGTTQTARDIGASVLLSAGTGAGQLDFTSGVVKANATQILGTAVSTPATAGILDVNVKNMNNVSGSAITTIKAVQGLATDGVIPTVTTLTNLPAITAGWLTASGIAASALNGKGDWNIGKTGYALSTAGVQAIWDALTSALATVGSIGKLLVDNINATISSRLASASYTAQTGDAYARLGAPVGASISADIAAVKTQTGAIETDTQDLQARTPAALVSGRMDASVGAMAANVLTATAINADAITAAKVAADVTTEIQSGLATSASISALNNVSTAQVQTAAAAALTAYDPPTRTEATADKDEILTAVGDVPTNAELATALASADDATLAAITSATSPLATQASVNTIDDFLDTEIAAIKAKTDQLTFTVANELDVNIKSVADTGVTGTGTAIDPWSPDV